MTPRVALVVVTYGHTAQLPATLASINAQQYPAEQLEAIIVENGDGQCAALARAAIPDALVLEPGRNLGFAGGCNLAVSRSTADIIILVNPDVELAPDFVDALVGALADPTVGIVGARLLNPDGVTLQHAGGELLLPLGLSRHRGYGATDGPPYTEATDVTYVTGAALGIRRDTWQRLGGIDEAFSPAYFEEVDLCLRVRETGLRVRYVPAARGMHHESAGLGKRSVPFYRLYHSNRLRLLFKHQDDHWLAATWLPAELVHLRTTADDNEIEGLRWAYTTWQAHLLAGGTATDLRLADWQQPAAEPGPPSGSELGWTLEQVVRKQQVTPQPFRSRIPFVARVRQWLNSITTETYLRPILQQQNDLNASLVELGVALERQRRTVDTAILCQGMLLAKVLGVGGRGLGVGGWENDEKE